MSIYDQNEVNLIGCLGHDPKVSTLPSGTAVASFSLATKSSYKDKEGNWADHTEWHRVVVYGARTAYCLNHLSKGKRVRVRGALRTRVWTDDNNTRRSITEIIVIGKDGILVDLETKRSKPGHGTNPGAKHAASAPPSRPNYTPPPIDPGPAFPSDCTDMNNIPF